MSSSSKLSFEQAINQVAKEHGLDPGAERRQEEIIQRFHNVPFWRWDLPVEKHYRMYKAGKCNCFNCQIKWCRKGGNLEYPLFDYEKYYLDVLEKHRLVACIKSRAAGISEVTLRYMEWLALRNRKLAGSQFIIVSAPAEELSLSFMRRIRAHLEPILGPFESREKTIMLNGVRIQTMPSHNLLQLRGITNVSFLTLEESSFWHKSEEEEILPIILPLRQKNSKMQIALISTPGELGSLMHQVHLAPQSKTPFYKVYIDWRQVVGKLYTEEEIETARRTNVAFAREYELAFGFGMGNVFNSVDIDNAVKQGEEYYRNNKFDPKAAEAFFIGVDPSGLSNSKHGLCMIALFDKIHVVVAETYGANEITEDEFMRRIISLRNKTPYPKQTKIFIDSANISFIKRLKGLIPGERAEDYQEYFEDLRKRKLITPPDEAQLVHWTDVIPISFARKGPNLLASLYAFLQRGDIVLHPKFTTLISELQSARSVPNRNSQFVLDKRQQQNSMDCLDALRLSVANLDADTPEFVEEQEEQEEQEEIYV